MWRTATAPSALMVHAAQEAFGYLDEDALHYDVGAPGVRRRDLLLILHAQAAG